LAGAAILLTIGARTLWSAFRIRSGLETVEETVSAARAERTSWVSVVCWAGALSGTPDRAAAARLR
jgi:hypothetical protein